MNGDSDGMLKALLTAPDRAPDEGFALRIERAVRAEERMRAGRRVAWSRFGIEMAAVAALVTAVVLIERLASPDSQAMASPFGPATAGLLLLALWICVSIRPDSGVRSR
jgi:hypothetical protein